MMDNELVRVSLARENRNWSWVLRAFRAWILQRRNTTKLILPYIQMGRPRNDVGKILLADYGLTKSQWHRRRKELKISDFDLDDYLARCVEDSRPPSLCGLRNSVDKEQEA